MTLEQSLRREAATHRTNAARLESLADDIKQGDPMKQKKQKPAPAYLMGVTCPGAQIEGTRKGPCGEHTTIAVTEETPVADLDDLLKEQGWLTLAGRTPGGHGVLDPVCPECGLAMVDWLRVQGARNGITDEGLQTLAELRVIAQSGLSSRTGLREHFDQVDGQ